MNRKAIAELVGLLAVLGGLVFVGLELRQNNVMAQATAYMDLGLSTGDDWLAYARDPEYNVLFRQSFVDDDEWWAALSPETTARIASDMQGAVRKYETIFLLVELDVLDEIALTRLGWAGFGDLVPVRRLWHCLVITSDDVRAALTQNWDEVPATTIEEFANCQVRNAPSRIGI